MVNVSEFGTKTQIFIRCLATNALSLCILNRNHLKQ